MTHASRRELEGILGAIREVEANLDRRDARAYGAVLVMWGVVAAACFAFSWTVGRGAAHERTLGHLFLMWYWLVPVAVALVVTLFVGARRWRASDNRWNARVLRLLAAGVATVALTAAAVAVNAWWYVAATWLAFVGVVFVLPGWDDGPILRNVRHVLAAALLLAGAAIVLWKPAWSYLAAAAALLVGLGGLGLAKYVRAE